MKQTAPCRNGLERCRGERASILKFIDRFDDTEPWYRIDIIFQRSFVIAAESALEPIYDGNTKLNWNDVGIVWRPEPQVVRSNRTGREAALDQPADGRVYARRHMTERSLNTDLKAKRESNN